MVLYFVSSSSIPRPQLPKSKGDFTWKGSTEDAEKGLDSTGGRAKSPAVILPTTEKPVAAPGDAPTTPKASTGLSAPALAGPKMNATFVTLARNSDLWDIVKSIRQVEDRFNRKYGYDWVFLNDKPFDSTFKRVTSSLISGNTHYEEIPHEHWSYPDFIDQEKAARVREDMAHRKIIYGDSQSYRHMCRFESGFFFRQEIMKNYEWYWRVEPSIELYCDIAYDPFKYMADNKKKYSFVLSLYEYVETIPTIWDSTKKYMDKHPEHLAKGNAMRWLSDDDGDSYNHCHFVSAIGVLSCSSADSRVVVQFRDWQPRLAAVGRLCRFLQPARPRWGIFLRAMGRCAGPLNRCCLDPKEGGNTFFQRHRLLACALHALPDRRPIKT